MTAKTTKDEVDKVEAVPAEEEAAAEAQTEETETEETEEKPARPAAKRKRRVRVIEVIDDEDLDEVLEALDAEDDDAEEEPPAKAKPAQATKPTKPAAKPRPSRLEPPEEDSDEEAPARKKAAASVADRPGIFGLGVTQAVVVVVLVALLASLAIWQWNSRSSLSSKQDEREAVSKVASAYGDVAFNYNAQNYQSQAEKAQKLMAGDLLEAYKKSTLPALSSTFKADSQVALTSKTNQVFVGSVNDKFATAVVMTDVSLKTKDGAVNQPATLLRLSLGKIDGKWKVTEQYPSGVNDKNQGQGQIPAVPGGGASESPKAEKSEKPKN